MPSYTYSFIDVQATLVGIGGAINLGYGAANADEGIKIAQVNPKNTMLPGADGNVMHSLRASNAGTVTVTLLKTSPVNKQLMAMFNAQTLSSRTHGKNTITVRDSARGDLHIASQAAFQKAPDINYQTEGDTVEWVFDCGQITNTLGDGE